MGLLSRINSTAPESAMAHMRPGPPLISPMTQAACLAGSVDVAESNGTRRPTFEDKDWPPTSHFRVTDSERDKDWPLTSRF